MFDKTARVTPKPQEICNSSDIPIPDETLMRILSHSLPEKIISLSKLSSGFNAIAYDDWIWRDKVALHFPNVFKKNQHLKTGYFDLFKLTYLKEYEPLTKKQRAVVSILKEKAWSYLFPEKKSENPGQLPINIVFEDLLGQDSKGRNLIMLVYSYMHNKRYSEQEGQELLDLFFISCCDYFHNNEKDKNGYTLTHWKMLCNQLTKQEYLRFNDIRDNQGNTLLHIACDYKIISAINNLRKIIDVNTINNEGQTPLLTILNNRHLSVLKHLMTRKKANILAVDNQGNGALHIAVDNLAIRTIKWLLAEPDAQNMLALENKDGETPLHRVLKHEDSRLLPLFHMKQKTVNPKIKKIVKLLCMAGADQLAKNKEHDTPLQKLIGCCRYVDMSPVAEVLLNHGSIIDDKSLNLLDISYPNQETCNFIKCRYYFDLAIRELQQNNGTAVFKRWIPSLWRSSTPAESKFEYYLKESEKSQPQKFAKTLKILFSCCDLQQEHFLMLLKNPIINSALTAQKSYEIAELINGKNKKYLPRATILLIRAIELFDDAAETEWVKKSEKLLSLCNENEAPESTLNNHP